MCDERMLRRERLTAALIHGGACAITLGSCLIVGLVRRRGIPFPELLLSRDVLIVCGTVIIGGTAATIAGDIVRSLHIATLLGVMMVAVPIGIVSFATGLVSGTVHQRLWFVAAAGAAGGVCAQVGVMLARSIIADAESAPFQFSLREVMFAFVLVAVLLGYLTSPV